MAANAVDRLVVVVERVISLLERLRAFVKRLGVLSMFVGLAAARCISSRVLPRHTLTLQRMWIAGAVLLSVTLGIT